MIKSANFLYSHAYTCMADICQPGYLRLEISIGRNFDDYCTSFQ